MILLDSCDQPEMLMHIKLKKFQKEQEEDIKIHKERDIHREVINTYISSCGYEKAQCI